MTVSHRKFAPMVGISQEALSRHIRKGRIQTDKDGRFYPESAERVKFELAINRLRNRKHLST